MANATIYMHLSDGDRFEIGQRHELQVRAGEFAQPLVLFLPKGQEQKIAQVADLLNEILTPQPAKQEAA